MKKNIQNKEKIYRKYKNIFITSFYLAEHKKPFIFYRRTQFSDFPSFCSNESSISTSISFYKAIPITKFNSNLTRDSSTSITNKWANHWNDFVQTHKNRMENELKNDIKKKEEKLKTKMKMKCMNKTICIRKT